MRINFQKMTIEEFNKKYKSELISNDDIEIVCSAIEKIILKFFILVTV